MSRHASTARCAAAFGVRTKALYSFIFASVVAASPAATAQPTVSPPGRLLASNCFQCHGTDGKGPGFDKLAGKSADKLYKKMKEYQSGEKDEGIMARHAMGFTDAQLRELTSWLAMQR